MAAEQQSSLQNFRLEEFRNEPLFYAVGHFDDCHDALSRAGSLMLANPGRNFAPTFRSAETPVREAFDSLVDTIIPDYDLGVLEERVSILATIKVLAEKERGKHFSSAAPSSDQEASTADTSADNTSDIEAETDRYVGSGAGHLTDTDIAAALKRDFAQNLTFDIEAFCGEETRLIKVNSQRVTEKQQKYVRVMTGIAAAALLGTALFAAWKISQQKPE